MIIDSYFNPTIWEYGVNVLAFVNPSTAYARGVVFHHTGELPAFSSQGTTPVFVTDAKPPIFGDNEI